MDPAAARSLLGVAADATPDDVRRAFLRLLHEHHPDVGGDPATTRALIEAHRTLTQAFRARRTTTDVVQRAQNDPGDSVSLELPPDEAFLALLDAADRIGDVTYVDAESGLFQARIAFDDGSTADLLVTLQGRAATGTTDAFCTLEPPDLPVAVVVDALVAALT